MNIFLRRIPANTKHAEISEFVAPALKSGFLRKSGRILNVEILALQDRRIGTIEYHGLVTLDSEVTVENVVRSLKNRRLNGRVVVVRPYYHRSWYNDPRQKHGPPNDKILEKRKGDRRRGSYLQVIKNASDRFSSEDDFFKTISNQFFQLNLMTPVEIEEDVLNSINGFEIIQEGDEPLEVSAMNMLTCFLLDHADGQKISRFQIYAVKKYIDAFLEKLKLQHPDSGIKFWILPVMEKGEL